MDKKEGRHSIRIIVRMTENEYEKFDTLYKKAKEKARRQHKIVLYLKFLLDLDEERL